MDDDLYYKSLMKAIVSTQAPLNEFFTFESKKEYDVLLDDFFDKMRRVGEPSYEIKNYDKLNNQEDFYGTMYEIFPQTMEKLILYFLSVFNNAEDVNYTLFTNFNVDVIDFMLIA